MHTVLLSGVTLGMKHTTLQQLRGQALRERGRTESGVGIHGSARVMRATSSLQTFVLSVQVDEENMSRRRRGARR